MCMLNLLEAASPFLLLVPGFLPLLFFAQSRLVGSTLLAKPAPVVCIIVFSLGPLAAVAAALGLIALAFNPQCESLRIAQTIVQSLVELGYRASILYLITPRSFAVLASRISLSQTEICRHNTILAAIHFATFFLSVIQASLAPSAIPRPIPSASGILAALFPIPLIIHLILSAHSARVCRLWGFISFLQTFSALAVALRIPQGPMYALCSALFTVLWGGSVLTLFYTISSAPLLSLPSPPLRLPKLSLVSSTISTNTPIRVQYETSQARQLSGALTSEDFTALRDPFASPPPVSPVSMTTPVPRFPTPIPTSTPRIILSPPPTPISKPQVPPRPKAKEIKPQLRGITKQSSTLGIGKRASSQSLQPLSEETSRHEEDWRVSGSEDALFLNDEALLSQILLNSLIREATSSSAPPRHPLERRNGGSSIYSETSMTTIRTRRDENGRRYGSEEPRDPHSYAFQDIEELAASEGHRGDQAQSAEYGGQVQNVAASQDGHEEVDDAKLHTANDSGIDTAWWSKP